MSMSALRAQAKKALLSGKYDKALPIFEKLHQANPKDLRIYAKLAEIRDKNGDKQHAVSDYIKIAEAYANDGFVVQAIAISKIILRIDPTRTEIQQHLKSLSEERGDDWAIRTLMPHDKIQGTQGAEANSSFHFERTPLLSMLSGDELDSFISSLTLKHFQKNEYVYQQGDKGDYLYLIGMGRVRLETAVASGKKKSYAQLDEGDFFGEQAFMARSDCMNSAIAESETSVLMIDRQTFDLWVEKYPNIEAMVESFYRQRVLARLLVMSPIFEGVPADARAELADKFQLRCFEAGEEIIRENEAGDSLFLIRSGRVKVFVRDMKHEGKPIILGEIQEGSFFGEVSLLTKKPRTATVVALSSVELMELTRSDFDVIVEQFPSVKRAIEAFQKKRVKDTIRTIVDHDVRR